MTNFRLYRKQEEIRLHQEEMLRRTAEDKKKKELVKKFEEEKKHRQEEEKRKKLIQEEERLKKLEEEKRKKAVEVVLSFPSLRHLRFIFFLMNVQNVMSSCRTPKERKKNDVVKKRIRNERKKKRSRNERWTMIKKSTLHFLGSSSSGNLFACIRPQ